MKKTVYLFDFDKTIIDTDSIFLLWRYAMKKYPRVASRFPYKMIRGRLKYSRSKDFRDMKNYMLAVLKYLTEDELKDFVHQELYPKHFYKDALELFNSLDSQAITLLVSASATNYLKFVGDILPFDYIIGTDLDENFKIKKDNNKGEVKVHNITTLLHQEGFEIDYEQSKSYSDSYKYDRYMMEMVRHRYLINSSKRVEGYENLYWQV
ncbi:MAG: HAD family hydrolase [Tissierellia bacterium]|nr:HAD family hydrolase [Tissierellia bacterium]